MAGSVPDEARDRPFPRRIFSSQFVQTYSVRTCYAVMRNRLAVRKNQHHIGRHTKTL